MFKHNKANQKQESAGYNTKQRVSLALALCMMRDEDERSRIWSRSWLATRDKESVYHRLVKELTLEDPNTLREWILLDRTQYQHLLRLVTPLIEKRDTNMRQAVTAGERLILTLLYLATGKILRTY